LFSFFKYINFRVSTKNTILFCESAIALIPFGQLFENSMKEPKLLKDLKACKIFFNEDLNAVQTCWYGLPCEGKELHDIMDAVVDAIKEKRTGIIIADARSMQVISREDQQWLGENWYPRALAAGFSHEALVVTQYTFNEVAVKRIVRNYDDRKVKTGYFKSMPSAYEWVKNGFPDSENIAVA
jgi:hypothetical protein